MTDWDKNLLCQQYFLDKMTLREMGKYYHVSYEQIRLMMKRLGLQPTKHRTPKKLFPQPSLHEKYPSLIDYLKHHKRIDQKAYLSYIPQHLHLCADCGDTSHIHIHHLVYPAVNGNEVLLLCASCHHLRHRKMSPQKQTALYNDRCSGALYKELVVKYQISLSLVTLILRKFRYGFHTYRR